MSRAAELVDEVLGLPLAERLDLVARLLKSLEEPEQDEGVEAAWDREVARRDGDDDEAFVDGEEALRQLRTELDPRPR